MKELEDDLRRVAREWLKAGWQQPDADVFRRLHAVDLRDHSATGRSPDRDAFWRGVMELYAAFPDFRSVEEDLIAEPARGLIAIRWLATGTHRGAFLGVAPTGKTIRFAGIEIIRAEHGLVQERWGEWNGLEIAQQMQE